METLEGIRIGGIEVNYYLICPRKLWLYAHDLEMEKNSDRVALGALLHEESYPRKKKDYLIDDLIRIDFLEEDTLHEVKLTKKMEEAHIWQLLYYLYYLKGKGLQELKGIINYVRSRRQTEVVLTPDKEKELRRILFTIKQVKEGPEPPPANYTKICRKCAYAELCWA